jgi:NTE family protein
MAQLNADLVLEGGGVKGIALVGAYSVIEERGYTLNRVAGTSAGSIVGACLAAGLSAAELKKVMDELVYADFQDRSLLDRIPLVGKAMSLILEQGIYEGKYALEWIRELLADHGVHTFGDLPYDDPEHPLPEEKRYRLVVMASDISYGRLRRLPWAYSAYGLEPKEQSVAEAVRASMSIPFFFEPVRLKNQRSGLDAVLVDGGMLSNFPVNTFDAQNREPRWPTFGIKLSTRAQALEDGAPSDVSGPISLTSAMIKTMVGFHDRMHVDDLDTQARTIFVDTGSVRATDFNISAQTRDALYLSGRRAAMAFFDGTDGQPPWDWETYKAKFRKEQIDA